jgi:hypothetical protein
MTDFKFYMLEHITEGRAVPSLVLTTLLYTVENIALYNAQNSPSTDFQVVVEITVLTPRENLRFSVRGLRRQERLGTRLSPSSHVHQTVLSSRSRKPCL